MTILDEIEIERKIRQTLLKYLRGADRGDHALRISAFSPTGFMFIDGVKVIGPGAVERSSSLPPAHGLPPMDKIIAMTHHLHQLEVVPIGNAFAVESDTTSHLVVRDGGDQHMLIRGVRYHDRMSRYGDEILIDERQHHIDWMIKTPELFQISVKDRPNWEKFVAETRTMKREA